MDVVKRYPDLFRVISLSEHTTWGIGGPCIAAVAGSSGELRCALGIIRDESLAWTVLGRGSNTLAPSSGWDGVAVMLNGDLSRYTFNGETLHAGGGAPLPSMAGAACSKGLSGLAFAVGIPGTVGGAVFMNAGAYGSCIADTIRLVEVMDPEGTIQTLSAGQCLFDYRTSIFQRKRWIVTGITADLTYTAADAGKLRQEALGYLRLRRSRFPLHAANAGSVFKRPPEGPPPGKLIEDCGLKGFRIGGAMVSCLHANFIENTGGATSDDVLMLMDRVVARVLERTGIELEREIRILGEDH